MSPTRDVIRPEFHILNSNFPWGSRREHLVRCPTKSYEKYHRSQFLAGICCGEDNKGFTNNTVDRTPHRGQIQC